MRGGRIREIGMLIAQALGHGLNETGSSGGADALLIILAAAIVLGLVYFGQKKVRGRMPRRGGDD